MNLSRREFVAYTAAIGLPANVRPPAARHGCVILPVRGQCSLPESATGYARALADVNASLLVIPAVLEIPQNLQALIAQRLQTRGTVLVESGAGFSAGTAFNRHRDSLREVIDVAVGAPVNLWRGAAGVPYVDYTWPHAATIRDFSQAVAVPAQSGDVIANAAGLPVALRRRIGSGTLIFLGSPLGPALWAGDAEARRWVLAVARASAPPPAGAR
ncbi:MAG TPA: hypothetical protein VKQ05_15060 [Gemmatimonadales bacterium]|nr:hypothetical protein [Gemmatimonadales bacterium]